MARGVGQWLWPMELPSFVLEGLRVKRACHALALDDERTTFHPILGSEKDESLPKPDGEGRYWLKNERISQVWFPGAHSNVGGGYRDDALAHISLHWIMKEASLRGLEFKVPPSTAPDGQNISGRLYDSRSGLKSYYR